MMDIVERLRRRWDKDCADAADEIVRLQKENEQFIARMHCMCGDFINHSVWEGHAPVSMYDHALDQTTQERNQLTDALKEARDEIERLKAFNAEWQDRCLRYQTALRAISVAADVGRRALEEKPDGPR